MSEKRIENRKDFSYYMRLTDAMTKELIGHLSDISAEGFKLDSDEPISLGKEYRFHLALSSDISSKPFMVFQARSKWCKADPIDPFVYNSGFHLTEIHPEDRTIFNRLLQLYGTNKPDHTRPPPGTRVSRW